MIRYSILDPTGNITALVETPVDICDQPAAADEIMKRCGTVEQVGFVKFDPFETGGVPVELRMAGGEFCGNAAMSAAVLYSIRCVQTDPALKSVRIRVSGAAQPVTVKLQRKSALCFTGEIAMPPALGIDEVRLSFRDTDEFLPVVRMEGISHIIIEPVKEAYCLLDDRNAAEQAVRMWCRDLSADGLGLLFLEPDSDGYKLTPLVYVPGSGTVFWENSCASGSAAAGMYLSSVKKAPGLHKLKEPGGELRVKSGYPATETWLQGSVRLIESEELPFDRI